MFMSKSSESTLILIEPDFSNSPKIKKKSDIFTVINFTIKAEFLKISLKKPPVPCKTPAKRFKFNRPNRFLAIKLNYCL